MITDSLDGSMVSVGGRIEQSPSLVPLSDLLGIPPADGGAGNVTVLLHYRGARADAVDRAGYRSTGLGFDFGRTPVFSLGVATDAQSFERVRDVFTSARNEKVRLVLIELASLHPDSDAVLPFLTRLVEPTNPTPIRHEAAEGFGHHHDPRSVDMLRRVAEADAVSDVRAEAAETIGEVQVPQSIPALTDLATQSPDPAVRREAAEAFGDQPPGLALPALEQLIATSPHEDVLTEAVEALGSIHDARVVDVLVRIATTHPNRRARQEAVETLGDVETVDTIAALVRIAWEHPDVTIQREAVETLGDRHEPAAVTGLERIVRDHPVEDVQAEAIETLGDDADHRLNAFVVEQALSGRTPRLRREALDTLAGVASGTSDIPTLDRIEQTLERAIFTDPDRSVCKEAIDALSELPRDRAARVLRKILQEHPDADLRRYGRQ
jgi:HEAT repeat protein